MEKRKQIQNSCSGVKPLYTEPEGQDFWLAPGEVVEIRAEVTSTSADFVFDAKPDAITVWPSEDMGHISVWSAGVLLECGYQRPVHSS